MGKKLRSHDNLLKLVSDSEEERKEDKASKLMEKNSTSKLHSKSALRKTAKNLQKTKSRDNLL